MKTIEELKAKIKRKQAEVREYTQLMVEEDDLETIEMYGVLITILTVNIDVLIRTVVKMERN